MMKVTQKLVGITDRQVEVRLAKGAKTAGILEVPAGWSDVQIVPDEKGLMLQATCGEPGRGTFAVEADGKRFEIPCVIFKEKEFFLCMVISSNFHYGYDPSGGDADVHDPYQNGHAFVKAETHYEPMLHSYHLPITWLIDPIVAREQHEKIMRWHATYGDDIAVMPTSLFYDNNDNYNINHTQEETTNFLRLQKDYTEYHFPFYTDVAGIDQWVGSVGSKYVKASPEIGITGLWGLGFDHGICDTSMYHRGCPWDVYKMDPDNYRRPSRNGKVWGFQWTTRDILNTVHVPEGTSGSVIFSTDPDDIYFHNIMATDPDYYTRLFKAYQANDNECTVFLMHQEDHDMHHLWCNDYVNRFLGTILPDASVTPATMEEITQWLNLKYPDGTHPSQTMHMEDVLAAPELVDFGSIVKPDDWGFYPPITATYDADTMVIYEDGSDTPYRLTDYTKDYPFEETRCFPEEDL